MTGPHIDLFCPGLNYKTGIDNRFSDQFFLFILLAMGKVHPVPVTAVPTAVKTEAGLV